MFCPSLPFINFQKYFDPSAYYLTLERIISDRNANILHTGTDISFLSASVLIPIVIPVTPVSIGIEADKYLPARGELVIVLNPKICSKIYCR